MKLPCIPHLYTQASTSRLTLKGSISTPKDYGINTVASTQNRSFIPFPFGVVSCLHLSMRIKFLVMQKQLRIITRYRMAVCPLSQSFFALPALPSLAFGRHLSRLPIHFRPQQGVTVRALSVGWFVWRYPSGRRLISILPF